MSDYKYLAHFGIKGMHWGERRWQDYAGRLTSAGRERYGVGVERARSLARFGAALGRAKGEVYRNRIRDKVSGASTGLRNQIRRRSHSVQLANLRGQRDYYERKARGKQFVKSLAEKKEAALRKAYMLSDSRFKARINAGERYVYRMSDWEDMMANPRGRDLSLMRALPTRFDAAKSAASLDWQRIRR